MKPGDVVQHKTCGQKMVVYEIEQPSRFGWKNVMVTCTWLYECEGKDKKYIEKIYERFCEFELVVINKQEQE